MHDFQEMKLPIETSRSALAVIQDREKRWLHWRGDLFEVNCTAWQDTVL